MGSIVSTQLSPKSKRKQYEEVNMVNARLTKLPSTALSIATTLKRLDLSRNKLTSLSSQMKLFVVLEEFNLSSNLFYEIPREVLLLPNLKELDISFNNIGSVPSDILLAKNLTHLSLKTNKLCQLPHEIGMLENLQSLRLENNFLENLPESMSKLTNLRVLNLACNELDSLPHSLSEWSSSNNIEELILFGNMLKEPPLLLTTFTNLVVLSLARNGITELPPEFFTSFPKLTRYILGANKLSHPLAPEFQLNSLVELDLRGNNIEVLPDLSQLTNLKILDLSFNPLQELSAESIQYLSNFQAVKIHNRQLVLDSDPMYAPLDEIIREVNGESNNETTLRLHAQKIQFIHSEMEVEYLQTAIPSIDKILPNLYLSSAHGANNYNALMQLEITHILTVAEELQPRYPHVKFTNIFSFIDISFRASIIML